MSSTDTNGKISEFIRSDPEYSNCLIEKAILKSNVEFVNILIDYGANVNTIVKNEDPHRVRSLLFISVRFSNTAMVQLLLSYNPDLYYRSYNNNNFYTPIEYAFATNNIGIFKMLVDHHMINYGIDDVLNRLDTRTLLQHIVLACTKYHDIKTDDGGQSRIMMIQYLLDSGANPRSAMDMALNHNLYAILDLFNGYGDVLTKGVYCDDDGE